ncbi:hypothetical protein DYB32_002542 [Aphanomyces invadans]|nr:hypothetical protein DYB32_002542 [Aphanomyces invadans]
MEFYSDLCIKDYSFNLEKEGKTLVDFVMGPNFYCLNFTLRLVVIIVLEHLFLVVAYLFMLKIPGVPSSLQAIMDAREHKFKKLLEAHECHLPLDQVLVNSPPTEDQAPTKARSSSFKTKSPPKDKNDSFKRKESLTDKAALARQWSD